ncbi:hypothetical protein [Microbacterium lacticum]
MSFLNRMFNDRPATSLDLHVLIDMASHINAESQFGDLTGDEIAATVEAVSYATTELVPGVSPDALLRDPYITRAISAAVNTANVNRGFEDEPNPARAIVVLSNDLGTGEGFSWALGNDISVDRRRWWYASDAPVQASAMGDRCHRCTPWDEDRGPVTRPVTHSFRIARGRYVIEFALCADCSTYYDSMFLNAV